VKFTKHFRGGASYKSLGTSDVEDYLNCYLYKCTLFYSYDSPLQFLDSRQINAFNALLSP
jgi:hypothetical protein